MIAASLEGEEKKQLPCFFVLIEWGRGGAAFRPDERPKLRSRGQCACSDGKEKRIDFYDLG